MSAQENISVMMKNGKVAVAREYYDQAALMRQLGIETAA